MRGRDGPPDKRLFRRARHGDRQAFGLLLRRYDPRLRGLVLRLVAEPERVDPVLRRAYVKAWRSLPMVDLPGTVAEWLYRVVYNACVNELRWAPERPPPSPEAGPRVPMPVASAERRLAGLRALTPEERIPLALVDGEGFSLEATARILQRPPVAVAADLSRARGRWRSFVLGDAAGADAPEVVELEPDVAAEQAEAEAAAAVGELGIEGLAVDPTLPEGQPRHVRVVPATVGNGDAPSSTPLDATEDELGGELGDEPATDSVPAETGPSVGEANPVEDAAPSGDGATQPEEAPADDEADDEADEKLVSVPAVVEVVEEVITEAPGKRPRNNGSATPSSSSTTGRPSRTEKSAAAAEKAAAGAGARRKRRRDAKREVRTRNRRAPSEQPNDESPKPGSDGDSASSDDPHETS